MADVIRVSDVSMMFSQSAERIDSLKEYVIRAARLGFAIATMNVPDILIIDEVLSVGDYKFQEKSFARMKQMMDSGAAVVFVSHSVEQVRTLCRRALWLEHGEVRMLGSADAVCSAYMRS